MALVVFIDSSWTGKVGREREERHVAKDHRLGLEPGTFDTYSTSVSPELYLYESLVHLT